MRWIHRVFLAVNQGGLGVEGEGVRWRLVLRLVRTGDWEGSRETQRIFWSVDVKVEIGMFGGVGEMRSGGEKEVVCCLLADV